MTELLNKVADFWCDDLPASIRPRLITAVEQAVLDDSQGVMLTNAPEEYSQQDNTNVLQQVADETGLPMSAFKDALMWVYPDGAEYKVKGRERFRDL